MMQADRQRMEAMAVEREAEQRRMAEILQYMQSLGAATGVVPPPSLHLHLHLLTILLL